MTKWEYLVLEAQSVGREGASFRFSHWDYVREATLNQLGAEGWEIINSQWDSEGSGLTFVLFKRPLLEAAHSESSARFLYTHLDGCIVESPPGISSIVTILLDGNKETGVVVKKVEGQLEVYVQTGPKQGTIIRVST